MRDPSPSWVWFSPTSRNQEKRLGYTSRNKEKNLWQDPYCGNIKSRLRQRSCDNYLQGDQGRKSRQLSKSRPRKAVATTIQVMAKKIGCEKKSLGFESGQFMGIDRPVQEDNKKLGNRVYAMTG